jgi:hypothetical protein
VAAALVQPAILYQSPTAIAAKVTKAAAYIGMPVDEYVRITLRTPSLFYLKAESVAEKIDLLRKAVASHGSMSLGELLRRLPVVLTHSKARLCVRLQIIESGLSPNALTTILGMPERKARALLDRREPSDAIVESKVPNGIHVP